MMVTAITCDLCQAEPAEMLQSNLGNGESVSVGAACMVTFFAGALAGLVGQLDGPSRLANEDALAAAADAIGLIPASEMPPGTGLAAAAAAVGGTHTREEIQSQSPPTNADLEYQAAKALIDDPSLYEDGNTDYGLEDALALARELVAEYEAARREEQAR